jgi:hypothetical protein
MERMFAEMLDDVAEVAVAGVGEPDDALEAEGWVSGLVDTWQVGPVPDPDADRLFGLGLVSALERLGGSGALAVLRALAAVGGESYVSQARAAADRLAGGGVAEPPWSEGLGQAKPVAALLMCEDDGFDDGLSVMMEFAVPGAEPHTLGIYIDHNMGGLVKDVFIAGSLASVREQLEHSAPDQRCLVLRELDLGEARVRVQGALEILDHTLDPPIDEDVRPLRALVYARIRTLPRVARRRRKSRSSRPRSVRGCSPSSSPRRRVGAGAGMRMPRTPSNWRSTSAPITTMAVRCAGARSLWRSS